MSSSIVSYGFEDGSFFRRFGDVKTRLDGDKFAVCFDANDWTLNAHGGAKDVRERAEALLSNYKKLGMADYIQGLRIFEFDKDFPQLQETLSSLNWALEKFALNGSFANKILHSEAAKNLIFKIEDSTPNAASAPTKALETTKKVDAKHKEPNLKKTPEISAGPKNAEVGFLFG